MQRKSQRVSFHGFPNPNGALLTTKNTKHTKGKLGIKEFGK
jgi:hypothetical protein